jgi:cobalamin-dependent methionine synthase I
LLATLPGERHGLGLAMAAAYLAASQMTPVLLGVETPAPQIVRAARSHDVQAVALLVTAASALDATAKDVRLLRTELPRRVSIWIGGAAADELAIRDETGRIVRTWETFDEAIAALARRTT